MNSTAERDDSDTPGLPVRRAKKIDKWSGHVTQVIGREIRHWRQLRKMTTHDLADATEALGHKIPRSVIANLEHERRDSVSVAEVLILAAALHVPPILLFAPIGREEHVEVLPNLHLSPWLVRGWVM